MKRLHIVCQENFSNIWQEEKRDEYLKSVSRDKAEKRAGLRTLVPFGNLSGVITGGVGGRKYHLVNWGGGLLGGVVGGTAGSVLGGVAGAAAGGLIGAAKGTGEGAIAAGIGGLAGSRLGGAAGYLLGAYKGSKYAAKLQHDDVNEKKKKEGK